MNKDGTFILCRTVRRLREAFGMTQADCAKAFGCDRSMWQAMEDPSDRRQFPEQRIVELAGVFRLSVPEFIEACCATSADPQHVELASFRGVEFHQTVAHDGFVPAASKGDVIEWEPRRETDRVDDVVHRLVAVEPSPNGANGLVQLGDLEAGLAGKTGPGRTMFQFVQRAGEGQNAGGQPFYGSNVQVGAPLDGDPRARRRRVHRCQQLP